MPPGKRYTMAKVEIKQAGAGKTKITLDGKDISSMVTRFSFGRDANKTELPILHLDIISTDISIDSTCIPELPDIFKPFYERKKQA